MVRPGTAVCMFTAITSGIFVYSLKHQMVLTDRAIAHAYQAAKSADQQTAALRIEWSMLNDPVRLQAMAGKYLTLRPIDPAQFAQLSSLGSRIDNAAAMPAADPKLSAALPSASAATAPTPNTAEIAAIAGGNPAVGPAPPDVGARPVAAALPGSDTSASATEVPTLPAAPNSGSASPASMAALAIVPASPPTRGAPPVVTSPATADVPANDPEPADPALADPSEIAAAVPPASTASGSLGHAGASPVAAEDADQPTTYAAPPDAKAAPSSRSPQFIDRRYASLMPGRGLAQGQGVAKSEPEDRTSLIETPSGSAATPSRSANSVAVEMLRARSASNGADRPHRAPARTNRGNPATEDLRLAHGYARPPKPDHGSKFAQAAFSAVTTQHEQPRKPGSQPIAVAVNTARHRAAQNHRADPIEAAIEQAAPARIAHATPRPHPSRPVLLARSAPPHDLVAPAGRLLPALRPPLETARYTDAMASSAQYRPAPGPIAVWHSHVSARPAAQFAPVTATGSALNGGGTLPPPVPFGPG